MKIAFYGDGITSGETNGYTSYVDYLRRYLESKCAISKHGISGTTFGEYSIYTSDGFSFLSCLQTDTDSKTADKLFIQYGLNDAVAVACKYATIEQVVISMKKCQDYIHKVNPNCETYFLAIPQYKIDTFSLGHENYINTEYFLKLPIHVSQGSIEDAYFEIVQVAGDIFDHTLHLVPNEFDRKLHLDTDQLNPNDAGHQVIAEYLMYAFHAFECDIDQICMQKAASEADRTMREDFGGPFGAVIRKGSEIIAVASNTVLKDKDPTCHAEINAIRQACHKLKRYDLSDCELYATGYPCPMCMSSILWSNIKKIHVSGLAVDAEAIGFRDADMYKFLASDREDDSMLKIQFEGRGTAQKLYHDYESLNKEIY